MPTFLVAGVRYNSFGKTSKTLVSLNHGLDLFFTSDNYKGLVATPNKAFGYIVNDLNLNFLRTKIANAYLIVDTKILVSKKSISGEDQNLKPNRLVLGTGLGVQPFPTKIPVKIISLVNLNNIYSYGSESNNTKNYYFSCLKVEYMF